MNGDAIFNYKIAVQLAGNEVVNPLLYIREGNVNVTNCDPGVY